MIYLSYIMSYKTPYNIANKSLMLISSISEKIGKLESVNILNSQPHLRKNNRIKSVHSSLKIEANSMSIENVRDILNGKNVVGPANEIIEVKNAFEAYEQLEKISPYSLTALKKIHGIMAKNIINESGCFRKGNEGVFCNGKCIFMAPPPNLVPELMNDLFSWLKISKKDVHPLIASSVFHYEFVFIHPFTDGNGRMARLWQTLILSKWKSVFKYIPIESQIENYQEDYYNAISVCHKNGDSTYFIEFMLDMINKSIDEIIIQNFNDNNLSEYVKKLLKVMKPDVFYTANRLLELLKLRSKEALRRNYLKPALQLNLIKMEIPDKPTSRNQRYILKIEDER